MLLSMAYTPTVSGAHGSVEALRNSPPKQVLVHFHYCASGMLLLGSGLLLLIYFGLGKFDWEVRWRWWSALSVFGSCFSMQLSGNLLPLDQHDVHTWNTEAMLVSRIPLIGNSISQQMLAGTSFSQDTLSRVYSLHLIVLFVVCVAAVLGLILSERKRESSALPWKVGMAFLLVPVCLSFVLKSPSGVAAQASDFALSRALPSWYTAPLHAAQAQWGEWINGGSWLGVALFPGCLLLALVLAPILSRRFTVRSVRVLIGVLCLPMALPSVLQFPKVAAPFGDQQVVQSELGSKGQVQPINPLLATKGEALFQRLGCTGCHGARGEGSRSAPNLQKLYLQKPSTDQLVQFLRDPTQKNPGSIMPKFGSQPREDLMAVAEYLRSGKLAQ